MVDQFREAVEWEISSGHPIHQQTIQCRRVVAWTGIFLAVELLDKATDFAKLPGYKQASNVVV